MNPLHAIRTVLLLTCRDAAPLLSRGMDQALVVRERAALRVHLWICPSCRRYRKQLHLIRGILSLCRAKTFSVCLRSLPREARERVRLALARHGGAG